MLRKTTVSASLLITVFLAVSFPSLAGQTNGVVKPLIAGQHTKVGTVSVSMNGNSLTATYTVTTPGMVLHVAHLYVGTSAPKSAAPGQFPFQKSFSQGVTTYSFVIDVSKKPVSWTRGKPIYVAAHAEVCQITEVPDFAGLVNSIADTLYTTTVAYNWVTSEFTVAINGVPYKAWCVDFEGSGPYQLEYASYFRASYAADGSLDGTAASWIGQSAIADVSSLTPLQALNYLLNQDYVKNCTDPTLEYEIQNAIWYFTDGRVTPQDADWVNAQDVQAIVNDVLTNAPNYVPKCGDLAAVIINPQYLTSDPTNSKYFDNQHLAMGVALGCTTSLAHCETAWAQDKCDPRFRTGWGSYFRFD